MKDYVTNNNRVLNIKSYQVISITILLLIFTAFFYTSCSKQTRPQTQKTESEVSDIKEVKEIYKQAKSSISPPETPDYIPVNEELSPLKERIVSFSLKDASLRDVLYSIAKTVGLNLVIESGVNPDLPITVSLKNISASEALRIILSSADYFYKIDGNILYVMAMDTMIFEFGQPYLLQSFSYAVGGDILGSTEKSGELTGNVTITSKSDEKTFNLWDAVETNLKQILFDSRGISQEEGGENIPSFSINRVAGIIIVTASKRALKNVETYLNTIKDALNRNLLLEARIVEVKLTEGLRYGIDWNAVSKKILKLGSVKFSNVGAGTTGFADLSTSSSPFFTLSFTGSTESATFTHLLEALRTQGDIKVLSNPRLNLMNGQSALLSVGTSQAIISEVTTETDYETNTTTISPSTENILSGILIGLVPFIDNNGVISLTITPIISELIKIEERTFGASGSFVQLQLPTIDLREMSTTIKIKNKEMIIIGGLIKNKDSIDDSEIPILGRIPLIGFLFRSHKDTKEKTELVIMIKPTIRKI